MTTITGGVPDRPPRVPNMGVDMVTAMPSSEW
jgi:hypothetical protein